MKTVSKRSKSKTAAKLNELEVGVGGANYGSNATDSCFPYGDLEDFLK